MTPKPVITRRRFLYSTAVAAGSASLTGPFILRAGSVGDKLNVAFIGVGNKGAENLKNLAEQNVVALCDIDENFLNTAAQKHPGARKYRDFRKLLEQKDIEAVVVTIPDHMHAVAALAAIKLGKHVYCEKPLTHDLYEARQLLILAQSVESSRVVEPAAGVKTTARSSRSALLVGALIGLLIGAVAALVVEPIVARRRAAASE